MHVMVLMDLNLSFLSNLDLLIDRIQVIIIFFIDIEHSIPELLVQE